MLSLVEVFSRIRYRNQKDFIGLQWVMTTSLVTSFLIGIEVVAVCTHENSKVERAG